MAKPLVIVESPAKARTIAGYLGSGFKVASSIGHVRDLPRSAKEIPARFKGESWAEWGINVEHEFEPIYVVPASSRKVITELKDLLKNASELYLATDEDREGEAIAWHLTEVLKPKIPVHRMVFHEITPEAIQEALQNPRSINQDLVNAQEARRSLDRLVGWSLSPVLWRKVKKGLSAGRVQSVAVRIIVQRERERMAFRSAEFWGLEGGFDRGGEKFTASLASVDGVRPATGRDFDDQGVLVSDQVMVLDQKRATGLAEELQDADFRISSVENKPYTRKPYPPFRTSTLQQEASRKHRFGADRTMKAAQALYENGYITYMRTDSTSLSEAATTQARQEITKLYGEKFLADKPRRYTNKVKNAQEAHEAIRPAGKAWLTPQQLASRVGNKDQQKVYELIWTRTLASQMALSHGNTTRVILRGTGNQGSKAEFSASGRTITFPGFLRVYVEGKDDPEAELDNRERHLPNLAEGEQVSAQSITAGQHATKPPARFTEASLVKKMEELGIGRPSTYASIISRIIDRGYVWKKDTALMPSVVAFTTIALLENYFDNLVDLGFTARMEDDLDKIALGEEAKVPWLNRFFKGNGNQGLQQMVSNENIDQIDRDKINNLPIGTDPQGVEVYARVGQFGPYLSRGVDSVSIPEDLAPGEITIEKALELLESPSEKILGTDPDTGLTVLGLTGRYGPYVQLGETTPGGDKPKRASLFRGMTLDELGLDDALRLLSIPREVGVHPESGESIVALNGRYGPYLKMGSETRNLDSEQMLLNITLEEAIARFAQPKAGRGRSAPPLLELGADPVSGGAVVVKDGRFGFYVTDGTVNASLRKDDTVENITLERAAELLEARRERMKEEGKWPPKARSSPSKGPTPKKG